MWYSVARTCEYVTRQTLDYDSFAQGRSVEKMQQQECVERDRDAVLARSRTD